MLELNKIYCGDCLIELKNIPDNSVDSVVTDPPYELGFMGKSWDNTGIANNKEMWAECLRVLKPGGHLLSFSGTRTYHRMTCAIEDAGFEVRDMVEFCYGSGFPKSLNVWKQLKKNCTCGNMEVYEKRIQLQQTLGEAETEYEMRLMQEADLSQTKIVKNKQGEVLQSGLSEQSLPIQQSKSTENVWERQPSLERGNNVKKNSRKLSGNDLCEMSEGISTDGEEGWLHNATQIGDGSTPGEIIRESGSSASQRPQSEKQQYREPCAFCKQYGTQAIRTLGIGTALKPAHEPICMARKPLGEKTVAENCLKWGCGGINIDESRVESNAKKWSEPKGGIWKQSEDNGAKLEDNVLGRFPANLIHDNSEEVRGCFPETKSGGGNKATKTAETFLGTGFGGTDNSVWECDSGNASRFFKSIIYQAKASKSERNMGCEGLEEKLANKNGSGLGRECSLEKREQENGDDLIRQKNNHPTVKPIALMEYLIKMVTPKGGTVLDPFCGSGSTGIAAKKNGFNFIGIEKEPEYVKIAEARIKGTKVENKLL